MAAASRNSRRFMVVSFGFTVDRLGQEQGYMAHVPGFTSTITLE
jgi:hypothetical protein